MDYFPAFLRLDGKAVLLVGGGAVALRKLRLLLAAGANVTVVAPDILPAMDEMLVKHDRLRWRARKFRVNDVDGQWLVVSATGDRDVDEHIAAACADAGVFLNTVDDAQLSSFITPAIVDRSPVVVAISSAGQAPVLARRIRADIERRLPRNLGKLAALAGRLRSRVNGAIRTSALRLRFWERFFDSELADDVVANRFVDENNVLPTLLAKDDDRPVGRAWLVGAGPGDPELLTLKAHRVLQTADVILYDRLVSSGVLELARRDARRIAVGKRPGCMAGTQADINALLVQLVAEGHRVCRLKGGDPFIFGRGGEEAAALDAHGLPFEIVPGITAAAGCAAAAGIPLTHRDAAQSVVLLTGHGKDSVDRLDWPSLARDRQTLAFYMGVRRFPEIMQNLIAHGRAPETPIAVIERGTTPRQRVVRGTLGQLGILAGTRQIESPSILIIGEVVAFAARAGAARAQSAGTPARYFDAKSAIPVMASGGPLPPSQAARKTIRNTA